MTKITEIIERKISTVHMTEQTLKEILLAVKEAKEKGDPYVLVGTPYSLIKFKVNLEVEFQTQESLGYEIERGLAKDMHLLKDFVSEKGLGQTGLGTPLRSGEAKIESSLDQEKG